MEKFRNKYGLMSAIALSAGSVIGCGVFIKVADVLKASGGSLPLSLVAWLVGGIIMVTSSFCFGIYASHITKFGGIIDYIEESTNKTAGYYLGYYLGNIYFPLFASQLAIIASRYFIRVFTDDVSLFYNSYITILIAFFFITLFCVLNYLAPKIANYFQVSVLYIKLAPIFLIIVAGLFSSLIKDAPGIIKAFTEPATNVGEQAFSFGEGIKITSFAYDGWICVTSLNAELKNPQKNLSRVMMLSSVIIIALYFIFFIGFSALIGNNELVANGELAAFVAFTRIFGTTGSAIFVILIFLSCLGSTNGNVYCTSRYLISLGYRDLGFRPKTMVETNQQGNFRYLPFLLSYLGAVFFLVIWHLAYRGDIPYFNYLSSMDTISCALLYIPFIFIYVSIVKNFKECNILIRYIFPIIAISGSVFFALCGSGVYQAVFENNIQPFYAFLVYLSFTIVLMIPSFLLKNPGLAK